MNGVKIGKRKLDVTKSIKDSSQLLLSAHKKLIKIKDPREKMCSSLIWQLNVDCFYRLFDYLSLDELIAIGRTCKRMQRLVGRFIYENYRAKRKTGQGADIYMSWPPRSVGIFAEFFEKMYIFGNFSSGYHFVGLNCTSFLCELRMTQIDLTKYEIECIKGILKGVEIVEMEHCTFKSDFYENFLRFCPKLRRLSVSRSSYDRDHGIVIGSTNDWLLRTYPTLEHLELTDLYEFTNKELIAFFRRNPNVRIFSTDAKSLLVNRDSFLESDIKLDRLAIEFHPQSINSDIEPNAIVDFFYKQLIKLHQREFFQELHLYITFLDHQINVQKLFTLEPLKMLGGFINTVEVSLANVTELNITEGSSVIDLDSFPDKVPNLERIHFSDASSDHILPFVRHSPKLMLMKIENLMDGRHLMNGALDLHVFNQKRHKMIKARKLIIYVNERVFLATRWTNKEMFFSRVEVRRGESFDWNGLNSSSKFVRSF